MTTLLSRLQALTGPDREIDAEIALANGWTSTTTSFGRHWYSPSAEGKCEVRPQPPRYTESLDAALTLVPVLDGPGCALWVNLHETVGGHGTTGCVWSVEIWGVERIEGGEPTDLRKFTFYGLHPVAAVALLIALQRMKEAA